MGSGPRRSDRVEVSLACSNASGRVSEGGKRMDRVTCESEKRINRVTCESERWERQVDLIVSSTPTRVT